MLISVGDTKTTSIAIVVVSIQDVIERSAGMSVDAFFRRLLRRCASTETNETDANAHRAIVMGDINSTGIAELVAIVVCPMLYILMMPQALALNAGIWNSELVATPTVFAQMLLQMCAEVIVIGLASWVGTQRDVPVLTVFSAFVSYAALGSWACSSAAAALIVLYGFVRHPNFMHCASNDPCDCLYDHLGLKGPYTSACSGGLPWTNQSTYRDDNLFSGVDASVITITLLTGSGMLAVIAGSVILARRKRLAKVAADLENEVKSLHRQMGEKALEIVNEHMKELQTKKEYELLIPYNVPRDHIILEALIGNGAMGEVWRGMCRSREVAVKRVIDVNERTIRAFRRECNIMSKLQVEGTSHPNLVQMLFCSWDCELLLLLELCHKGTLRDILADARSWEDDKQQLVWKNEDGSAGVLARLAYGIACGMRFMHAQNPIIMHRDLKPCNVLIHVNENDASMDAWTPKICDFGESRTFNREDEEINLSMVGTPYYCPPEIVLCQHYDESVDVYSFGVMLHDLLSFPEIAVGKALWGNRHFSQINVVKGRRPDIPCDVDFWLVSLITRCWSGRTQHRPSFETICNVFDQNLAVQARAPPEKLTNKPTKIGDIEGDAIKCLSAAQKARDDSGYGERFTSDNVALERGNLTVPQSRKHETSPRNTPNAKRVLTLREGRHQDGDELLESIDQSKQLNRAFLLAKIFGYAIAMSLIFVTLFSIWTTLAVLVTTKFTTESGLVIENFPVFDIDKDTTLIFSIIWASYGIITIGNVGHPEPDMYPECGPKYALVPLALTALVTTFLVIAFHNFPFDSRYYMVDVFSILVIAPLFMVLDIFIRSKLTQKVHNLQGEKKSGESVRKMSSRYISEAVLEAKGV